RTWRSGARCPDGSVGAAAVDGQPRALAEAELPRRLAGLAVEGDLLLAGGDLDVERLGLELLVTGAAVADAEQRAEHRADPAEPDVGAQVLHVEQPVVQPRAPGRGQPAGGVAAVADEQ